LPSRKVLIYNGVNDPGLPGKAKVNLLTIAKLKRVAKPREMGATPAPVKY